MRRFLWVLLMLLYLLHASIMVVSTRAVRARAESTSIMQCQNSISQTERGDRMQNMQ